jgi:hypothetical protein
VTGGEHPDALGIGRGQRLGRRRRANGGWRERAERDRQDEPVNFGGPSQRGRRGARHDQPRLRWQRRQQGLPQPGLGEPQPVGVVEDEEGRAGCADSPGDRGEGVGLLRPGRSGERMEDRRGSRLKGASAEAQDPASPSLRDIGEKRGLADARRPVEMGDDGPLGLRKARKQRELALAPPEEGRLVEAVADRGRCGGARTSGRGSSHRLLIAPS